MNDELFESYLSRSLDRDLTAQEFAELEQHLIGSPEARARYLEYVDLHTVLDLELQQATSPVALGSSSIVDIDRIIRRQKRRSRRVAMISAAAILIIGVFIMQVFLVKEKRDSLTFQTSPGTQFTVTHSTASEAPAGMVMENGSRLQLSQGTVELAFKSGVKSIVIAPADMTLHDDDILFLNKGRAWFQVPGGAEGFTVNTGDLNIVDLGTEFGVIATPDDHDEVHVFKGKVKVTAQRLRKESSTLTTDQSCRIDPIGKLDPIPSKPNTFLTVLPKSLPYIRWSFDTEDGFQATGTHPAASDINTSPKASPKLVPGKRGKALFLNGHGQSLVTDWPGFSGNRPRTVSCWIKLPKNNSYTLFSGILGWGKQEGQGKKWKVVVTQTKKNGPTVLRLSLGDHWVQGTTDLADGNWYHIAVTTTGKLDDKDRLVTQLYVNGRAETLDWQKSKDAQPHSHALLDTDTVTNNAIPLTIGSSLAPQPNARNYFKGFIDELTIFDGHMTQDEVQQLVNP